MSTTPEQSGGPRAVRAGLCLAALLAAGGLPAHATVSLEAAAGVGGYYRAGEWVPLRLQVANDGEPLEAEVRIDLAGQRRTVALALPAPAKKDLYAPLPVGPRLRRLEVRLTAGDRVLARQSLDLRPLAEDEILVAVAAGPGALPPAPAAATGGPPVRRVRLDVADLPDDWRGLAAVDELVFDVDSTALLTARQRRALRSWLQLGGRMRLVGREPETFLSRVDPATVRSPAGRSRDGEIGLGFGSLTRLGDAAGAGGAPAFERRRVAVHRIDRRLLADHRLGEERWRPPVRWLAAFLGLYVGAFSLATVAAYRAGRPPNGRRAVRRAVLGVPAVVLAFTLLALAVGPIAFGGAGRLREASIVHVYADSGDVFAAGRASFEAAARGRQRLHTPAPGLHFDPLATDGASEVRVGEKLPASLSFRAAAFGKRTFFIERDLIVDRPPAPSGSAAAVFNRLPVALGPCLLAAGGRLRPLPDLAPGGRLERLDPAGADDVSATGSAPEPVAETPSLLTRVVRRYGAGEMAARSGPLVACHTDELRSPLAGRGRLERRGEAVVLFHLRPPVEGPG